MNEIVKLKTRAYDCMVNIEFWQKELQSKTDEFMEKIEYWQTELQTAKDAMTIILDR